MRGFIHGFLASQLTNHINGQGVVAEVQDFKAVSVAENSITVEFLPDPFFDTQISCHPDCDDNIVNGGPNNRTFYGLESGRLYTFVAVNEDPVTGFRSEPVTVNQDTVPPVPESLSLSTFEILEVEIKFFGVPVPHRVETNGVLAEWSQPDEGHCDCYDANIDPTDGIAIEPKNEEGEVNEGQQSRQFIHLVPGKEYDVSVWGKTCGNGQIANLKSAQLHDTIVIPPESPSNARFRSRDSSQLEICFKGPAEGYFTGFDFVWENAAGETGYQYLQINDEDDTYNYRNEHRQYCYTLDGLRSCMKHTVEIYTSHNGIRSTDKAMVRTETLPETPQGLRMINFDSDSIHLKWENTGDSKGYLVNVKPDDHNITVSNNDYVVGGLSPGQSNEFEVSSFCVLNEEKRGQPVEYKLWSMPAVLKQSTLPKPPATVTASCSVGASSVDMDKESSRYFRASLNQEIIMNLNWEIPESGHWDGFVVSYSPFISSPENPDYIPPFTFGAGVTSARINLPRTDQKYTVYVRAIADDIQSEAEQIKVVCGEPVSTGKMCLAKAPKAANIDMGRNNVEINLDHLAMDDSIWGNLFSADDPMAPQLEFRGGNGHTGKSIIIRSDNINCAEIECNSLKLNFNVCTAGFGCESRFVAAACPCANDPGIQFPHHPAADDPHRMFPGPGLDPRSRPGHVKGDACCGSQSYSSDEQSCCHDKTFVRDGDEHCCGTQKYNKKMFKCCGSSKGWGIASIGGSCDGDLIMPEKERNLLDSW